MPTEILPSDVGGVDCVSLCRLWLTNEAEQHRLLRQWGDLEARLARNFRWFKLSPDEQRALPEAAPLYEIDARLERLFSQREALAPKLPRLTASSREAVMLKFEIVTKELVIEDFPPIHGLLKSAVRDLGVLWR
jgi:hypothetical protein